MDEVTTYAAAFGIDRGRLGYWRYIYADHGHGHPGRRPGEASWAGVRETRDRGAGAGSGHAMNISTGVEPGLSAPTGAAGERVAAVRDEDEGHTDRGGPEARSETWPGGSHVSVAGMSSSAAPRTRRRRRRRPGQACWSSRDPRGTGVLCRRRGRRRSWRRTPRRGQWSPAGRLTAVWVSGTWVPVVRGRRPARARVRRWWPLWAGSGRGSR